MIIEHFPHSNVWLFNILPIQMYGAKTWLWRKKVKSQPTTLIWTNLVDLEFLMLYTKIKRKSILGSWEDF